MTIEFAIRDFNCKKCFRQLCAVNEELFNKVYKGEFLCVKCRMKEGKKLTYAEGIGILIETVADKVKNK